MDANDELRETFFYECEDLLEVLESGLLDLSGGGGDDETINAVFRAVHSIKGGAGAFALEELVRFAHRFETALDKVRSGELKPEADLLKVFLRAADMLSDLVAAKRDGGSIEDEAMAPILAELNEIIGESGEDHAAAQQAEEEAFDALPLDFGMDDDPAPMEPTPTGPAGFLIIFKPHSEFYSRGNETLLLLRALFELGDAKVTCDLGELPEFSHLKPGDATLSWKIELETQSDIDAVREIFEFAHVDSELSIEPLSDTEAALPAGPIEAPDIAETETIPSEPAKPDIVPDDVATAPEKEEPAPTPKPEAAKEPAAAPSKAPKAASEAPVQTVRVSVDRIERVINLVGELVITQAMLSQRISESDLPQHSAIVEGLDEFKMLTRDIQESVMAIRAQPVKPLFQRMTRIVREASQATGKPARLVSDGEATEVDKTIVERLADPLTHMIRNAVDHGLEDPEARAKAGKPAEGIVRLAAMHRSGRIVIEVSDDGGGINREKVKEIAESKGLISPDAVLTDSEIDNLLFMPGFSTAKEVSDLSGRGVGMDVVKRAIQALGGRTSITSEPGKGTTFAISLPLTLAVLDGIVVSIADQTIIVPLTNIVETLSPPPSDVRSLGAGAQVVLVRGEPLPIIDVGVELGFREEAPPPEDAVFIITESHEGAQHALIVDAIFDQRQVVIKGLGANYGEIPGIAAATILGDGRIALILDVEILVQGAAGAAAARQPMALAG